MRRPLLIALSFVVVGLGACATVDDGGTPQPTPPQQVTTVNFVAEAVPIAAIAPIDYRWSPEPAVGQGTSAVSYDIVQLASGIVSVTAEQCGAFTSAELELGHDVVPLLASVEPAQIPPPTEEDINPPSNRIGFDRPIEDWIYRPGQRRIYYFDGRVGDQVSIHMERLWGNLDPYLQLIRLTPEPAELLRFDDNSGEGLNALIDGVVLHRTGTYAVYARGISTSGT